MASDYIAPNSKGDRVAPGHTSLVSRPTLGNQNKKGRETSKGFHDATRHIAWLCFCFIHLSPRHTMSDGHVDESIDSRRQSSWKRRLSSLTPSMKYVDLFRGLQPVEGLLLFVGTLASIAAGVPLPIIGLLFGKMVDGFNRQACASRSGMPTDPAERDDFLHQVSNHVVQIIIVAAINFVLIWIYTCLLYTSPSPRD